MSDSEPQSGPRHHPEPEDLLEYASGGSPEWHALLIACHLTHCARCRDEVALLDEVGAAVLRAAAPAQLGAAELDASAARAFELLGDQPAPTPAPAPRALTPELERVLPRPLHPYLVDPGRGFRFMAPGIAQLPLTLPKQPADVRVVRLKPGFVIPRHGHSGLEWMVVLDGEIGDSHDGERYRSGDVCRSEPGKVHFQDVSATEPCIAVVANLGPLVPKTLLGRMLAKIVKL
jgi:putative transcriptional regulator